MWKTFAIPALALALATISPAANAQTPPAAAWEIGPWIKGKNYSVGMPLRPAPTRTGWSFDFPATTRADGHVHYVTFNPGALTGKSRIVVRYRVDARSSTRFVPQEHPDLPGTVSLFLQRRGDTWTAKGRYDQFRWYAPDATVQAIRSGMHTMTVELDDPDWISVWGAKSGANRHSFQASLQEPWRIGLVFGSTAARGHGVFATAPARFELIDFRIE